ncbi:hypothetical protein [Amycolatopsis solani]|uniref:hypothetical protein n=1 Tax=Amycolatopsis solani TaxID=3028615 RepID=UPI0025B1039E|nr:hypothetical protein [Amycolatopsis sp. MEP2-6]
MARKVLVKQSNGEPFTLSETPAPDEHHLQEVLKHHPELLPLDDLGLSGPLLIVGRETRLASGSVDLVGLTSSGEVVLVEFKTGPQNPDFRAALAQLVDYGSDLWGMTVADFDNGVVQRYLTSQHYPVVDHGSRTLQEFVARTWSGDECDWDGLVDRLAAVLSLGDFHFVVAAQRFTPQMTTSLDYLNTVAQVGRYHLVQMVQLTGAEVTAYSAQLVAGPAQRGRSTSVSKVNEAEFLAAIDDDTYRDALVDLLAACRALDLTLAWGARGTSIRMVTPDRPEPISVGWLLPDGYHWQGLKYVSLGYDTSTATQTPSVFDALESYTAELARIPGGEPAKAKSLKAWTRKPGSVPAAMPAIVEVLESLVQHASGEPGDSSGE